MVIVPLYGAVDKTQMKKCMEKRHKYTLHSHFCGVQCCEIYVCSVCSVLYSVFSVFSVYSVFSVVEDMRGRAVCSRCSIKLLMSHLTGPD